jgi:hypothetical protein
MIITNKLKILKIIEELDKINNNLVKENFGEIILSNEGINYLYDVLDKNDIILELGCKNGLIGTILCEYSKLWMSYEYNIEKITYLFVEINKIKEEYNVLVITYPFDTINIINIIKNFKGNKVIVIGRYNYEDFFDYLLNNYYLRNNKIISCNKYNLKKYIYVFDNKFKI